MPVKQHFLKVSSAVFAFPILLAGAHVASASPCQPGAINFNDTSLLSYSAQDADTVAVPVEEGCSVYMSNNTWVETEATYTITEDTLLSFGFLSSAIGEIHAIGFENDDVPTWGQFFSFAGSQREIFGRQDIEYTTVGEYTTFYIEVGKFFTGDYRLVLVMDQDAPGLNGNSYFDNIRLINKKPPTSEPSSPSVVVSESAYGSILTAGANASQPGFSLYTFDPDTAGQSNCSGNCLVRWPAVTVDSVDDVAAESDAIRARLGTIERSDNSELQLTFDDKPLYYFQDDEKTGDTVGHTVGDVWWLATLDGSKPPLVSDTPPQSGDSFGAKFEPPAGKQMMIVGQDLQSVAGYVDSGKFPTPAGVTSYIAFFNIATRNQGFGALGLDESDQPNNYDHDWGAGPLNAHSSAVGFSGSTLQLGMSLTEGDGNTTWCGGCLSELANGGFQAEINQLADFLLMIDKPVYLRIGYEFDGNWNQGYERTGDYVKAYRNIVDGLRNRGVDNVAYVWQSSTSPVDEVLDAKFNDKFDKEDLSQWYPGDDYVDWIGLSWFLLPGEKPISSEVPGGFDTPTQLELANDIIEFSRARSKPVMIAEATPQGYDIVAQNNSHLSFVWDGAAGGGTVGKSSEQIWDEWYANIFKFMDDNLDIVKAVSYINANWNTQTLWAPPYPSGYWGDGRVEANDLISNKWVEELNKDKWLHGGADLFPMLDD